MRISAPCVDGGREAGESVFSVAPFRVHRHVHCIADRLAKRRVVP